ncbi:hypothetical protein L228DRAFT_208782 [Xylona heveae TC161]|uniref:Protein BNI4 n=1 Tax=Xylona heveae (strain CBS 132557 / TC161) TaxID=1328760 RepID=A0A161TDQ1_XYLHT|nr:hypothetical protein L228DRAFT_208782 [Xylona heveae TC161]KZF24007.1 hypothetical protein L228DRAFT_208782 [Xylona heveae TC161]
MAALVQTLPQQTTSVTMLQTRPTSASGAFQTNSSQTTGSRSASGSRGTYNGSAGSGPAGPYRASLSPVAPYAFTSTPNLSSTASWQNKSTPHLRPEHRTLSAPVNPNGQLSSSSSSSGSSRNAGSSTSATSFSSDSSLGQKRMAKDDTSVPSGQKSTGKQFLDVNISSPSLEVPSVSQTAKPSPDRYRRNHRRAETNVPISSYSQQQQGGTLPSGSGMTYVGHLYNHAAQPSGSPVLQSHASFQNAPSIAGMPNFVANYTPQPRMASADDMLLYRRPTLEHAKQYSRRSISSFSSGDLATLSSDIRTASRPLKSRDSRSMGPPSPGQRELRAAQAKSPRGGSHSRNGSSESVQSHRSETRPSSVKRDASLAASASKQDPKHINIPARGTSEGKRPNQPSSLSKPTSMGTNASTKQPLSSGSNSKAAAPESSSTGVTNTPVADSKAVSPQHASPERDGKKGVKSRLRRAFSFGSAAELRRASAENNIYAAAQTNQQNRPFLSEHEAEQARKQEAAGIGEGIYSGQGNIFTGSTDNLSISSTASSASVMIRKMGKGMKRSTRSLAGLFRPKSVIGVPSADSAMPAASVGEVSMVTVEAEREKVNVNAKANEQMRGGTGFPKLERNSLDAVRRSIDLPRDGEGSTNELGRKRMSIAGGDKERAEVLAAVKKGILKRTGTDSGSSSPTAKTYDGKALELNLPNIPQANGTPGSTAPSTPADDQPPRSAHRRTESVGFEGDDYFTALANFSMNGAKSAPVTPQSMSRNISFSPRIQFHDTWPSGEYDRRGDIATCNRLTPMLAQQIKEELNTFKMEMEVHEQSKVYTHFF